MTSIFDAVNGSSANMDTSDSMGGVVFLIIILAGVFVTVALSVSAVNRFLVLRRFFQWIARTTGYFGYGLVGTVPLVIAGGIVYGASKMSGGDVLTVLLWVGGLLAAYFLLAGYGWLVKRFVARWRSLWRETEPAVTEALP